MRKMICDKCGKEITYGSDYYSVSLIFSVSATSTKK